MKVMAKEKTTRSLNFQPIERTMYYNVIFPDFKRRNFKFIS